MVASLETPQALNEATTSSVPDRVAVGKPIGAEAVRTRESPPRRVKVDAAPTEKARKSADLTRLPNSPVALQRRIHPLAAAAAVAFVAIGVGAPWIYKTPVISRVQQLAMSFQKHAASEIADVQNRAALPTEPPVAPAASIQDRSAVPPEEHPAAPISATLPKEHPAGPSAATPDRKPSTPVSAAALTPTGRKPMTPAASPHRAVPSVGANTVRVKEPNREVPAVPVLASAPVISPHVVEVVATAPAPAPATPPPAAGPFFETKDVSESPRIATRAEPRLPDELRHHSVKEMIIVRALVSQNGHPSRVSLLRRSKTGPQLDDVVLAAVNQWTFSPAKKKGEPVSCWFNFAVEVGGAE
jgi:protein TonB